MKLESVLKEEEVCDTRTEDEFIELREQLCKSIKPLELESEPKILL